MSKNQKRSTVMESLTSILLESQKKIQNLLERL